jgi:hypothetical protein
LARKLGMGREDGAGEAWKVAPANAVAEPGLLGAVPGGVFPSCFAGPGDVETFFDRDLLPVLGFDFVFTGWELGAGLFDADFCGVKGVAAENSMGTRSSGGMSFSDTYVLLAGELFGCRPCRRREGVALWRLG